MKNYNDKTIEKLRKQIAEWLAMKIVYGRDEEFNPLNLLGLSKNEKAQVYKDADSLVRIIFSLIPQKVEVVRGVLDYAESMFPELESTYWQGKRWKKFRKEQTLPKGE